MAGKTTALDQRSKVGKMLPNMSKILAKVGKTLPSVFQDRLPFLLEPQKALCRIPTIT
jgi:hypothetical protein